MFNTTTIRGTILAAALSTLCGAEALAQNTSYQPGDLILGFQNPGGTTGSDKVVLVRLGDTAFDFRDAASNQISLASLASIGSTLTTNFGANWWEAGTLYMSLVGVWSSNALSTGLQHEDPTRTLYVSRGRDSVGIAGTPNSVAVSFANSTDATSASSGAFAAANSLEVNGTTATVVLDVNNTTYDDKNGFAGGIQQPAYDVISGGVQFGFQGGSFGTLAGQTIEGALDLYRIQTRSDRPGQYGEGNTALNLNGEFQGTITINQAGNVSFIVTPVPEPTTALLLGLGSCAIGFHSRRRMEPSPLGGSIAVAR